MFLPTGPQMRKKPPFWFSKTFVPSHHHPPRNGPLLRMVFPARHQLRQTADSRCQYVAPTVSLHCFLFLASPGVLFVAGRDRTHSVCALLFVCLNTVLFVAERESSPVAGEGWFSGLSHLSLRGNISLSVQR